MTVSSSFGGIGNYPSSRRGVVTSVCCRRVTVHHPLPLLHPLFLTGRKRWTHRKGDEGEGLVEGPTEVHSPPTVERDLFVVFLVPSQETLSPCVRSQCTTKDQSCESRGPGPRRMILLLVSETPTPGLRGRRRLQRDVRVDVSGGRCVWGLVGVPPNEEGDEWVGLVSERPVPQGPYLVKGRSPHVVACRFAYERHGVVCPDFDFPTPTSRDVETRGGAGVLRTPTRGMEKV